MTDRQPEIVATEDRQTHRVWRSLGSVLGLACALVLTAMMFLTGADVVARYVLNAPIRGAFELTEILLVCLVFLAMPLAMMSGAHVEVELWQPKSRSGDRFRTVLSGLAALIVFLGLAWQLFEHAGRLKGHGSESNSLGIPLYAIALIAALGCALGALIAMRGIVAGCKP